MHKYKLRAHVARAAGISAAAMAASLVIGVGAASATIPDPLGGANPVAPHFYNGNVEAIRDAGSDTTFFVMQKIGDLYTGAGLYGCTLNSSAGQTLYNTTDPASATTNEGFFCQANQNQSTTEVNDNWDRTEVTEGVDVVGSGAGQNQLCNALSTPLPVDIARSSKPSTGACAGEIQTGYAKDGVPIIDYPVNPNSYGTSTTAPYSNINGGVVGDVTSGWLPGDNPAGPYTGTALVDVSNADNGGGADSTAYRLWCSTATSGPGSRISDWGQLTNLGPNLLVVGVTKSSGSPTVTVTGSFPSTVGSGDAVSGTGIPAGTTVVSVSGGTATLSNNASSSGTSNLTFTTAGTLAEGDGAPIGVPLRIMGVNTNSGTEATWASYAESGVSGGGCASNMDTNAASDPNPATATGENASPHVGLENNSAQIAEYAVGDFPSPDYVDQAIEVDTTLYIESNGVFNTDPYASATTINGTAYSGNKVTENGVSPTTPNELANKFPTARTLFNIYNSATIRGSAGGFLNWICDGNTNFTKGLDNSTGKNFDTELTSIISSGAGFPRLTDTTAATAITTPADNLSAPDNSCAASQLVTTSAGSNTITLTAGGSFPSDIVNAGGLVGGGSVVIDNGVVGAAFPAGTTVVSGAGTSTLTLSNAATTTGTNVPTTFSGVPSVTTVAQPQK